MPLSTYPKPVLVEPSADACRKPSTRAVDASFDWERLEPIGFYARTGRPIFHASLLVASVPAIVVLGILIALIQLALFRDPRRIFFTQQRVGRRGKVFRIFKFRTMREPAVGGVFESWSHGLDQQRVTRFGRFLRNSHFDELPQILNVLRGEMSLIGPRPEMVEIEAWAAGHVPGFTSRLCLRPGITGHAQITQGYTGRSIDAYVEKLRLNELYRARISFAADVSILVGTVCWMARGRGWGWNQKPVAPRDQ